MILYLIRHGETDWNLHKKFQGITDNPLNETGIKQAKKISAVIKKFDVDKIYASTLKRAQQTAEETSKVTGLDVHIALDIQEVSLGEAEGLPTKELAEIFKNPHFNINNWKSNDPVFDQMSYPGGEQKIDCRGRVYKSLSTIAKKNIGNTVAVFFHSFCMRQFLISVTKQPVESIKNCEIIKFIYQPEYDQFKIIKRINPL